MTQRDDHELLGEFCLKVAQRRAVIGVIGLGYVGLPLALEFVRAGFHVVGVDVDRRKVEQLREGHTNLADVSQVELLGAVRDQQLVLTHEYDLLCLADAILICVPTPVTAEGEPDLRWIKQAASGLARVLTVGKLVSLESTTYPGTTEEVVLPLLTDAGLEVGEDLFLCYSPERVDPANPTYNIRNTPKVVAGCTTACQAAGMFLYASVVDRTVPVSSPRTAEMVKLLENVYRSVNIALVNEMATLCGGLGIDIWEVINAAATKPFGFTPFYPGPGIGGHCTPIDPLYLQWKLDDGGYRSKFIDLATEVNEAMPDHIVDLAEDLLHAQGKQLQHASVLVLGITYKRDVSDVRESPGLRLMERLQGNCYQVRYHDPLVPTCHDLRGRAIASVPLSHAMLQETDCIILTTDHSCFRYDWIARNSSLILDTRNAFGHIQLPSVHRLGTPLTAGAGQLETAAAGPFETTATVAASTEAGARADATSKTRARAKGHLSIVPPVTTWHEP